MDRYLVSLGAWTFAAPSVEDWFATTTEVAEATDFGEEADAVAAALGGVVIRLPTTQVPA